MIRVSEKAKAELRKMLAEKVDNPLAGIRLVRGTAPGLFGLAVDIELPGDQVVEHAGSKILLVDKELSKHLDGSTIDVEDTAQGKSLVVLEKSEDQEKRKG
jgi:Fe-S cluster assembly iron-binding protein IscA